MEAGEHWISNVPRWYSMDLIGVSCGAPFLSTASLQNSNCFRCSGLTVSGGHWWGQQKHKEPFRACPQDAPWALHGSAHLLGQIHCLPSCLDMICDLVHIPLSTRSHTPRRAKCAACRTAALLLLGECPLQQNSLRYSSVRGGLNRIQLFLEHPYLPKTS